MVILEITIFGAKFFCHPDPRLRAKLKSEVDFLSCRVGEQILAPTRNRAQGLAQTRGGGGMDGIRVWVPWCCCGK